MTRVATLKIAQGVSVVVPDALNLITPYVLFEQQDWFEDEIKFLRHLLQPGERVVDIGANYGVYAFSMAQTVGPQGAVFAFEPAATTADYLQQGIAANGFTQVVLERAALSDAPGTARLATSEHAELNALEHGAPGSQGGETVRVTTLDEALERHGWTDIDFVKIDAEGEEARIIRGGRDFFSRFSPLVLYEVKAGDALNVTLAHEFAAIGYASYRLVPGLQVLVPFDATRPADGYLLNLFCCRPDRAAALARRGLLAGQPQAPAAAADDAWQQLAALPYGAPLAAAWRDSPRNAQRAAHEQALADFLASQDRTLAAAQRFGALLGALGRLATLCAEHATPARRASLARVAAEAGARSLAVHTLGLLNADCAEGQPVPDLAEPFLAVTKRFETLDPGGDVHRWLRASILESIERLCAYSSYYTGREALGRLEALQALGFGDPEMQRRLQLVRLKFPATAG